MATEEDDDQNATPARHRTRSELVIGKADHSPRPTILDALDGLPRPDDEIVELQGVAPETDENIVCTEGGPWLRWDETLGATMPATEPFREDDLVLHGFTDKGRDGAPRQDRIYRHLITGDLYRRSRPMCAHYLESVQPENSMIREGGTKGPALTLLRMCVALNEALSDESVLSCAARFPRDLISEEVLVRRNRIKRAQAALPPTKLFKEISAEELAARDKTLDPYASDVREHLHHIVDQNEIEAAGMLFVLRPEASYDEILRYQPLIVFFPDKAWQPLDQALLGHTFIDLEGQKRPWGVSSHQAQLHGEIIARWDGKPTDDFKTLQRFRRGSWLGTCTSIAQAILDGRNVSVVPYHQSTADALVKEVSRALARIVQALIDGYEQDGRIAYDEVPAPASQHVLPFRKQDP